MHTPAISVATSLATTPLITPGATPTTCQGHEHDNTPEHLPTKPVSALTHDFHLDTFFNPVWMSGPNVFSFAEDGVVVHPKTHVAEPYLGYHADWIRLVESADVSHFQGLSEGPSRPWKSVAITEQDDAEFAEFQAGLRAGAVGEWRQRLQYGSTPSLTAANEPELVYTWPPKPQAPQAVTADNYLNTLEEKACVQ